MNINTLFGGVSVIAFIISIIQFRASQKMEKRLKTESILLYRDAGLLMGEAKRCADGVQNTNLTDLAVSIGKVAGLSESIFNKSVQLYNFYHALSLEKVDEMIKKGTIDAHHRSDFLKYVN